MGEGTKAKVTIADVARLAGVSTSSVSNVLNDRSARMRPETKERIDQAIKRLGYTPNMAARQLKTGHSKLIGLVVPSVANPFYGNFARFVEEAALERGYQVMLGNSSRDPLRERQYAEQLWGAGVEGIIFGTSLPKYDHLEELVQKGMNVVTFDRPVPEGDPITNDTLSVDNLQIMRLIVKHLVSLGHKRIGFISGPIRTQTRKFRLQGYITSLQETGIPFDPELVWEGRTERFGDSTAIELGRQGAHDILSRPNGPTAVCTINDMYAFGVYAGARDLGLHVPRDVSVVGVDNIVMTEVVDPQMTTIEQPLVEMARAAVARIVDRLEGKLTEPPSHQVFSPKLIVRASTARCKDNL